jgi:alpha-amylase
LAKFHLVLLIHAHQPVGNFEDVLAQAYSHSYLPFLELLLRHPLIRLGLHYSGPLLEWFDLHHPEFFDLLRELIDREQVELVGGGFYEPILIAIPPEDRHEQLCRLADYIEKKFGRRPAGAWLAERVWEPHLPFDFAKAGVDYTLVDDIHFLASGFELDQLHGYYIAEELGATVKVIPGLKALRYLIPFRSVEDNIEFLRAAAARHPGEMAAMGDDNEKFGVWPGTYDHCYRDAWLERFFAALEANSDWLDLTPPGEYLAAHPPLGRADLPTSSYTELTEWALPTPARLRFHAIQQEFSWRPDVIAFLRGSIWRNFLSKYSEANLLHKKMLCVSEKVRRLGTSARRGLPLRQALDFATTHLLRAQCNDAYWHGVFGGVYAPHLRTAIWRELIRAEKLADAAAHGHTSYAELSRLDFDADGREELYLTTETYAALVKPADGGTIAALDFRPADATLINSMQRRPEPYHVRLAEAARDAAGAAVSIHDRIRVKEPGLGKRLRYDRWPRHAFRLLLFPASKTRDDYDRLALDECATLAAAPYRIEKASDSRVALVCEGTLAAAWAPPAPVSVAKTFSLSKAANSFEIVCDVRLSHQHSDALQLQAGIEVVLDLLAPDKPDRYFEVAGERHPLSWAAAVPTSQFRAVDEWQGLAIALDAPDAREFWVAPIETVSESEDGFERVYQGSQILAVWPLDLAPAAEWTARLALRVTTAR